MKNARSETGSAVLRQTLSELHREAWAWALNCCDRNRADAEDVLHTTYLKILEGRARFDGRSSTLTWLFAVIRRTAADLRRRRYLRNLLLEDLAGQQTHPAREPPAEVHVEAAQARRSITNALAALARRQREVLTLVFYHELTIEDAAQIMGVSAGAARQHYARGKHALRALLAAEDIRP
ncbi:MAG: RNA polymerase sigma factor [Gemmatimonadetes bacterium]|nr:RNA polymerase sigma factor [Gemmatimonadota bacterium]